MAQKRQAIREALCGLHYGPTCMVYSLRCQSWYCAHVIRVDGDMLKIRYRGWEEDEEEIHKLSDRLDCSTGGRKKWKGIKGATGAFRRVWPEWTPTGGQLDPAVLVSLTDASARQEKKDKGRGRPQKQQQAKQAQAHTGVVNTTQALLAGPSLLHGPLPDGSDSSEGPDGDGDDENGGGGRAVAGASGSLGEELHPAKRRRTQGLEAMYSARTRSLGLQEGSRQVLAPGTRRQSDGVQVRAGRTVDALGGALGGDHHSGSPLPADHSYTYLSRPRREPRQRAAQRVYSSQQQRRREQHGVVNGVRNQNFGAEETEEEEAAEEDSDEHSEEGVEEGWEQEQEQGVAGYEEREEEKAGRAGLQVRVNRRNQSEREPTNGDSGSNRNNSSKSTDNGDSSSSIQGSDTLRYPLRGQKDALEGGRHERTEGHRRDRGRHDAGSNERGRRRRSSAGLLPKPEPDFKVEGANEADRDSQLNRTCNRGRSRGQTRSRLQGSGCRRSRGRGSGMHTLPPMQTSLQEAVKIDPAAVDIDCGNGGSRRALPARGRRQRQGSLGAEEQLVERNASLPSSEEGGSDSGSRQGEQEGAGPFLIITGAQPAGGSSGTAVAPGDQPADQEVRESHGGGSSGSADVIDVNLGETLAQGELLSILKPAHVPICGEAHGHASASGVAGIPTTMSTILAPSPVISLVPNTPLAGSPPSLLAPQFTSEPVPAVATAPNLAPVLAPCAAGAPVCTMAVRSSNAASAYPAPMVPAVFEGLERPDDPHPEGQRSPLSKPLHQQDPTNQQPLQQHEPPQQMVTQEPSGTHFHQQRAVLDAAVSAPGGPLATSMPVFDSGVSPPSQLKGDHGRRPLGEASPEMPAPEHLALESSDLLQDAHQGIGPAQTLPLGPGAGSAEDSQSKSRTRGFPGTEMLVLPEWASGQCLMELGKSAPCLSGAAPLATEGIGPVLEPLHNGACVSSNDLACGNTGSGDGAHGEAVDVHGSAMCSSPRKCQAAILVREPDAPGHLAIQGSAGPEVTNEAVSAGFQLATGEDTAVIGAIAETAAMEVVTAAEATSAVELLTTGAAVASETAAVEDAAAEKGEVIGVEVEAATEGEEPEAATVLQLAGAMELGFPTLAEERPGEIGQAQQLTTHTESFDLQGWPLVMWGPVDSMGAADLQNLTFRPGEEDHPLVPLAVVGAAAVAEAAAAVAAMAAARAAGGETMLPHLASSVVASTSWEDAEDAVVAGYAVAGEHHEAVDMDQAQEHDSLLSMMMPPPVLLSLPLHHDSQSEGNILGVMLEHAQSGPQNRRHSDLVPENNVAEVAGQQLQASELLQLASNIDPRGTWNDDTAQERGEPEAVAGPTAASSVTAASGDLAGAPRLQPEPVASANGVLTDAVATTGRAVAMERAADDVSPGWEVPEPAIGNPVPEESTPDDRDDAAGPADTVERQRDVQMSVFAAQPVTSITVENGPAREAQVPDEPLQGEAEKSAANHTAETSQPLIDVQATAVGPTMATCVTLPPALSTKAALGSLREQGKIDHQCGAMVDADIAQQVTLPPQTSLNLHQSEGATQTVAVPYSRPSFRAESASILFNGARNADVGAGAGANLNVSANASAVAGADHHDGETGSHSNSRRQASSRLARLAAVVREAAAGLGARGSVLAAAAAEALGVRHDGAAGILCSTLAIEDQRDEVGVVPSAPDVAMQHQRPASCLGSSEATQPAVLHSQPQIEPLQTPPFQPIQQLSARGAAEDTEQPLQAEPFGLQHAAGKETGAMPSPLVPNLSVRQLHGDRRKSSRPHRQRPLGHAVGEGGDVAMAITRLSTDALLRVPPEVSKSRHQADEPNQPPQPHDDARKGQPPVEVRPRRQRKPMVPGRTPWGTLVDHDEHGQRRLSQLAEEEQFQTPHQPQVDPEAGSGPRDDVATVGDEAAAAHETAAAASGATRRGAARKSVPSKGASASNPSTPATARTDVPGGRGSGGAGRRTQATTQAVGPDTARRHSAAGTDDGPERVDTVAAGDEADGHAAGSIGIRRSRRRVAERSMHGEEMLTTEVERLRSLLEGQQRRVQSLERELQVVKRAHLKAESKCKAFEEANQQQRLRQPAADDNTSLHAVAERLLSYANRLQGHCLAASETAAQIMSRLEALPNVVGPTEVAPASAAATRVGTSASGAATKKRARPAVAADASARRVEQLEQLCEWLQGTSVDLRTALLQIRSSEPDLWERLLPHLPEDIGKTNSPTQPKSRAKTLLEELNALSSRDAAVNILPEQLRSLAALVEQRAPVLMAPSEAAVLAVMPHTDREPSAVLRLFRQLPVMLPEDAVLVLPKDKVPREVLNVATVLSLPEPMHRRQGTGEMQEGPSQQQRQPVQVALAQPPPRAAEEGQRPRQLGQHAEADAHRLYHHHQHREVHHRQQQQQLGKQHLELAIQKQQRLETQDQQQSNRQQQILQEVQRIQGRLTATDRIQPPPLPRQQQQTQQQPIHVLPPFLLLQQQPTPQDYPPLQHQRPREALLPRDAQRHQLQQRNPLPVDAMVTNNQLIALHMARPGVAQEVAFAGGSTGLGVRTRREGDLQRDLPATAVHYEPMDDAGLAARASKRPRGESHEDAGTQAQKPGKSSPESHPPSSLPWRYQGQQPQRLSASALQDLQPLVNAGSIGCAPPTVMERDLPQSRHRYDGQPQQQLQQQQQQQGLLRAARPASPRQQSRPLGSYALDPQGASESSPPQMIMVPLPICVQMEASGETRLIELGLGSGTGPQSGPQGVPREGRPPTHGVRLATTPEVELPAGAAASPAVTGPVLNQKRVRPGPGDGVAAATAASSARGLGLSQARLQALPPHSHRSHQQSTIVYTRGPAAPAHGLPQRAEPPLHGAAGSGGGNGDSGSGGAIGSGSGISARGADASGNPLTTQLLQQLAAEAARGGSPARGGSAVVMAPQPRPQGHLRDQVGGRFATLDLKAPAATTLPQQPAARFLGAPSMRPT